MADELKPPAQVILEAHLSSVRFQAGVEDGRWAIHKLAWPHLYICVMGKDFESGRTFSHDFHIECEGYPDPGPFVERWIYSDIPACGVRPPSPTAGSPGFVDAFKDWSPGGDVPGGIYRAWQRHAASHNDWATKNPSEAWRRDRAIVFIMEHLYALLSEQAVWLASHT